MFSSIFLDNIYQNEQLHGHLRDQVSALVDGRRELHLIQTYHPLHLNLPLLIRNV
jgi:hypothetical protein